MTMSFYSAWKRCQEPVITQRLLRKDCELCSILSLIYICTHHTNGHCADFRYNRIRWPINFFFKKNLYTKFCNILWNRFLFVIAPNLTTMYSNKWWVKETGTSVDLGILLGNKGEQTISTLSNFDTCQWHYVEWKKAGLKRPHRVWFLLSNVLKMTKPSRRAQTWLAGVGTVGRRGGAGRPQGAAQEGALRGIWHLWQSGSASWLSWWLHGSAAHVLRLTHTDSIGHTNTEILVWCHTVIL